MLIFKLFLDSRLMSTSSSAIIKTHPEKSEEKVKAERNEAKIAHEVSDVVILERVSRLNLVQCEVNLISFFMEINCFLRTSLLKYEHPQLIHLICYNSLSFSYSWLFYSQFVLYC